MGKSKPHPSENRIPSRPIYVGNLRALEAVARHLNFRLAAEELALTQSAVSRQVQALEDEVGVPLFFRHTRAVELTSAGSALLSAASPSLDRLDSAVRLIRQSAGRKTVTMNTFASFVSMWLIPRLEAFQSEYPDIDIRIDATDKLIEMDTSDADMALRYTRPEKVSKDAIPLFAEQLTPVASPWLLKGNKPLNRCADLANHALIEAGDHHRTQIQQWLNWRRWLDSNGHTKLEPKRWLYLNYAHQILQAALTGQGVALARMPLVADSLASGDLVEIFPGKRMNTPYAYFLIEGSRSSSRPEVKAFSEWILAQAQVTRLAIEKS